MLTTFINGFPSDNDYVTYVTFSSNAEGFGANRSDWRENFGAYIIGPDGEIREFEGFAQPLRHNFSKKPIPKPGSSGYLSLQKELERAKADANNKCEGV